MADPITINALASTGRVDVRDPKLGNTFSVLNANFSVDADITVDFGVQSQGQTFGVVRSMFLDNGTNPEAVEVYVSGTDQFFTVPAYSIGYYTLDANAASRVRLVTVGGATDVCTTIFYNWPRDPVVWYSFGAFNSDKPIRAQGTMDEGDIVATDPFKKPVFIGGLDRSTGEFHAVGVDALGRLDFSSTINVGGVYGADPMGAPPINPGFPQAVLNSAGNLVYVSLNTSGEFIVHDADTLAELVAANALLTTIAGAVANNAPATSVNRTSVVSAAVDTLLIAAGTRDTLSVFNDSTSILYLGVGSTAVSLTNYTVQLQAGGYYEVPDKLRNLELRGIWNVANGNARITEGV